MKHLYVISGAMGVGKTAVCQQLKPLLAPCAFLDGDWCWDMEPFTVNKENRTMVMGHIQYLLRGFLQNSGYENVIFCWVLHQEGIWRDLLTDLSGLSFALHPITLTCTPDTLFQRLSADIDQGRRKRDVLLRSRSYLPLFHGLPTVKIPTDGRTPQQVARMILQTPPKDPFP